MYKWTYINVYPNLLFMYRTNLNFKNSIISIKSKYINLKTRMHAACKNASHQFELFTANQNWQQFVCEKTLCGYIYIRKGWKSDLNTLWRQIGNFLQQPSYVTRSRLLLYNRGFAFLYSRGVFRSCWSAILREPFVRRREKACRAICEDDAEVPAVRYKLDTYARRCYIHYVHGRIYLYTCTLILVRQRRRRRQRWQRRDCSH